MSCQGGASHSPWSSGQPCLVHPQDPCDTEELSLTPLKVLLIQSCPTFCNPADYNPPGSSVGDSPGKNTGVVYRSFPQGIFPTQNLNLDLLHHRWVLYRLSHKGTWCTPFIGDNTVERMRGRQIHLGPDTRRHSSFPQEPCEVRVVTGSILHIWKQRLGGICGTLVVT